MNETALHVAVKRGHLESVCVLLDKQARLDVADNNGQIPLHAAVASASLKIVELLLEKMLGPMQETLLNKQDSNGNTALHLAAIHRRPEVIRLLQKLYPDIENKDGETALHVAAMVGTAKEVRTILQMFYTNTGTNIDHKDDAGYSALYHSACAGDPEKLSLIMSYGADLSLTSDDGVYNPPWNDRSQQRLPCLVRQIHQSLPRDRRLVHSMVLPQERVPMSSRTHD